MKYIRRSLLLCLVLLSCLCARSAARAEETTAEKHTTTVMVYLCGSDLESRFGSASRDLEEMMAADFDPDYTKVLVMTGGAYRWKLDVDSGHTSISQLDAEGLHTLWQSEETLNMGEPETLRHFLDYGCTRFPADRYALILWDHGGGPNEGLCRDERFHGDCLSLRELRSALMNSPANTRDGKLSWIGFDACLMASVETAYMLRDYAQYMIASQATEPASGWDYRFLKDLECDADAAQTARRIIDTYIDGRPDSAELLTLSCVDLGRIWELRGAMDDFFEGLVPSLSDESFSELSRVRHETKGFGRAEFDEEADFDLVDLACLAEAYESEELSGAELKTAVDNAVVYARSSAEGAHGLSVYHPCYNRELYSGRWGEEYVYQFGGMSRGYTAFVQRFGHILTGRQLGDWSGLETIRTEDADGLRFSVTLTDEQAANIEHATLLLLKQVYTTNRGLLDFFYEVWETPYLELDENNTLSAAYPKKAVYVVDENGKRLAGPVEYRITREGKLKICVLYYDQDGILDDELLNTMYTCSPVEEDGLLEVENICAFDETTHEYSTRMSVDEDYLREQEYTCVSFISMERRPEIRGGELPGFRSWPMEDAIVYEEVALPCRWHFEVCEDRDRPETVYALFQISDTQSLTHSSSLCRVHPELVETRSFLPCDGEATLHVEAQAEQYLDGGSVSVRMELQDLPAEVYKCRAGDLVLNDTVQVEGGYLFSYHDVLMMTLTREQLLSVDELRSLQVTLTMIREDYSTWGEETVRLELAEPIRPGTDSTPPLASAVSEDGLVWNIRAAAVEDSGRLIVNFDLMNPGPDPAVLRLQDLVAERYAVGTFNSYTLAPDESVIGKINVSMHPSDIDDSYHVINTLWGPLGRLGTESIASLRLLYRDASQYPSIPREVSFRLAEPLTWDAGESTGGIDRTLAETDGLTVSLEQSLLFHDERHDMDALSLCLRMDNESGEAHRLVFDAFSNDGEEIENSSWMHNTGFDVPAEAVRFRYLQIELPAGAAYTETVSCELHVDDGAPILLTLPLAALR